MIVGFTKNKVCNGVHPSLFIEEQCYKNIRRGNSLNTKGLAVCVLLLVIGASGIPITAQDNEAVSSSSSRGTWWYVGGSGPGNYTSIQDAIDNASTGDTVFVYAGTYVGYVVINKALTLIGEEKNMTCIIGYFAYTLSIVADGVNMSGFTITNSRGQGEGVRIDSSYNNFFDNIIDTPEDRIRLFGHGNTITGNTIRNTYLYISGDNNLVSGNTITNDQYGIYLVDCWDNIISHNSLLNCGLFISLENMCTNMVTENTVNGKPLVYVSDESDLVLEGDAGQILLVNCTNVTMHDQALVNTTVGVQIIESESCTISSCTIAGNDFGICLNGWNNSIVDNTIQGNENGIFLSGGNNTISSNTIRDNTGGLYLGSSTKYNTIAKNIISYNRESVLLDYGSDGNFFVNNSISYNDKSIWVSSDNNTFSGNTIADNDDHGISLACSKDNNVLGNSIANNNGTGILVDTSDDNDIIGNTIRNNTGDGISLLGKNNTVSTNIIRDNDNGIYVLTLNFNMIMGNTVTWNKRSGISLVHSHNNTIVGNSILKNAVGIYLGSSTNNTVLSNNFGDNKQDATFNTSRKNTWRQNYWSRPRFLPKLIVGTIEIKESSKLIVWFNVDWRPAFKPFDSGG